MNILKVTVTLVLAMLSMPMYAGAPMNAKDIAGTEQQPWVLVETHISTEANGGSIGSAFQEFSSKDKCESAIKLLNELAKRHRGGLGGAYKVPIAQCTPK